MCSKRASSFTEGRAQPAGRAAHPGRATVQNYLIQEVQKVYRQQGVDINDKHIEVIVRQMMRKVRVEDPGDPDLLSGPCGTAEVEQRQRQDAGSASMLAKPPEAGQASRSCMGITKAPWPRFSFLSAASFQETTRC